MRTEKQVALAITLLMLAAFSGFAEGAAPAAPAAPITTPKPIRMLFLGDRGHHQPLPRARQLLPILKERGIDIAYTEQLADLNSDNLAKYDGLIIYANHGAISPQQEKALIDYVEGGGGFVPIHCASYCFLNSPKYIALVGAQFQRHGTGVFRVSLTEPNHEIAKGLPDFESWDETYVHTKHNEKDRVVLQTRREGDKDEPWTWVRTQGKGRVFYTAWGHDFRTWSQPGFVDLIERGIRWSVKQPAVNVKAKVQPFEYREAVLPNYLPGGKWGAQGEPIKVAQLPLPPAESMKHLVLPPGFEAKLYASDPKIFKPIAMAFDERGRVWIAETIDYPNELQEPGKGRDRISILEDTDGDGVADKFTVFAEKLSIPTSLLCVGGGVIVAQAPDMLFLRDTDGDGKADERKVLFTGWGANDTHAGPSNLHYGFDNWIYGMVGYSGFNGTVGGKAIRFGQGFFRFRIADRGSRIENPPAAAPNPQSAIRNPQSNIELEFLRSTNNNSWGVGISEEGLLFGSTANGNPSMFMAVPNRYYESVRGWSASVLGSIAESNEMYPVTDKVRQVDWHHKFTAGSGHELYTARAFPREFWNRVAFVTEPTGHLAQMFYLERKGADYVARTGPNILASADEWTAPIVATVGPDGAVWVIDWYNFIVQHNPTPQGFKTGKGNAYETPERDKRHGRIYRIVYDERLLNPPLPLGEGRGEGALLPLPLGEGRGEGALLPLPLGEGGGEGKTTPGAKTSSTAQANSALTPALSQGERGPEQLIALLQSDNLFWRLQGQRLLVERGKSDVIPQLIQFVRDQRLDAIGNAPAALHALWTLHGLGAYSPALVPGSAEQPATPTTAQAEPPASRRLYDDARIAALDALKHPAAAVRRAATMVLPREEATTVAIIDGHLMLDADPQVRLAAFLALAEMPASERAGAAIYAAMQRPVNIDDKWIADAATAAAAAHDAAFLRAVLGATERKGVAETPSPAKPQPRPLPVNLIANPSFETVAGGKPEGWAVRTYNGEAAHKLAEGGRTGKYCLEITSTKGADSSWYFDVAVKPNTHYRFTGWIKTKGLKTGTGLGALFNAHELQGGSPVKSQPVTGNSDWTQVEMSFNSGGRTKVGINCLFGGWGQSIGAAWYDDLELIELGAGDALASPISGKVGDIITLVTKHYALRAPTDSIVATLTALKKADEGLTSFVLAGLSSGWPAGKGPALTEADKAELAALMAALPAGQRDRLVTLADRWGQRDIFAGDVAAVVKTMAAQVGDAKAPVAQRVDAARRLVRLADEPATIDLLARQLTAAAPQPLVEGFIAALGDSRHDRVAIALTERWSDLTGSSRRAAVATLMRRTPWTLALLDAIEQKKVQRVELSAADWQLLKGHSDKAIAAAAEKAGGPATNADRVKVLDRMLPYINERGDLAAGQQLFVKLCQQCHTMNGQGGKVGPELTGIGAREAKEILAEIVDPNRSLEANFRLWTVVTEEGDAYAGRLDSESTTAIEILDLQGKRHAIQRKDIVTLSASSLSIMPVGLIDALKPEEVASLMAYLKASVKK